MNYNTQKYYANPLKPEVQQEIMVTMDRIYTMNPHKSEVNKWTETQAEITDILKKHTAANKRQTKLEIRVVEAKLAALNRNHKLLGAKPAGLKLEQKYQRTLYSPDSKGWSLRVRNVRIRSLELARSSDLVGMILHYHILRG